MKTHALALFVAFVIWGCASSQEAAKEEMLLGWVDRTNIESPKYPQFKATYDTVKVEKDVVEFIREVNDGVDFLVFFGSWCSDSKREVPRFLKVADMAGIDAGRIRFYGLDRTKKSDDGLTDKHEIQLVPTFIVFKNGKELGRIVEKPRTTIEDDLLSILAADSN
jgi:thioredoxin 1